MRASATPTSPPRLRRPPGGPGSVARWLTILAAACRLPSTEEAQRRATTAAVEEIMATERIPGFCALCRSRCGCVSVVEDGRLVGVEADPAHPTGRNLCVKGRAAPELVYAPDRLLHPMKRTRPRGDADPGWVRIGWDEALDWAGGAMRRVRDVPAPRG